MKLFDVMKPIIIEEKDTDSDIMIKVGEMIGQRILFVDWNGESGKGANGIVTLENRNGNVQRVHFRSVLHKKGGGGVIFVGMYMVPYADGLENAEKITKWVTDYLKKLHLN